MKNLRLLSKIALSFQNLNDFDRGINKILEDIGNSIGVSRVYIFLNDNKKIVSNTFEWCNEGISPQIDNLQKFNYQTMPSFQKLLETKGFICSQDILQLPKDMVGIFKAQDIKSIVAYPLKIHKKIIGFIGFDECRYKRAWKKEELEILNTISGLVSNAYKRKFDQENLIISETNFRNFFETIEDLFVITDLDGQIIHCNKSLIDKLGYSLIELKTMKVSQLNPIDKRLETSYKVDQALHGVTESCQVEIESKSGNIYSVETRLWYGKWNSKKCIFSISKDISQENENLELFSTIFENNPLPTTITSIDEGRILKINPEFIDKTGYSESDIVGKTVDELDLFMDLEKLDEITNKQLNGENIIEEEISIRCKDSSILIGLFSVEEITLQGQKALLTVMVDITERVELARSVEDKYQKLTNIIDGVRLGTWEWDIRTNSIQINDQWAQMLGYSLEELEDESIYVWSRLSHPDDLVIAYEMIDKHLKGKADFYDCELRMKHKDGRWLWIQTRGKILKLDSTGKPLKMFGTHTDIDAKKQAEKTLRENEKRFYLALDKTEAGLWDLDLTNKSMFLSPMWKKILGYSDDEIENSIDIWERFIHPEDKGKIETMGRDFLNRKSDSYETTSRFKHKDGSWRWLLIRGGALTDENNVAYRMIGTIIDVTFERSQSLEIERFFSISLDLLSITDLKGNFIKANKAWEDILGYPAKKLLGDNFLNFIHPDDLPKTLNSLEKLKRGKKISHFVNRYIHASGDYRYIEWRSNPYENTQYASGRDITDRINYEKTILDMSNRDSLTNVYNRRYIFSRAKEIIAEYKRGKKSFSICIIDIDNFKKINDSYGHQAGDYILKEFTRIIHKNLRPYDLLGRYGGEEFIIILNDIDAKNSKIVIDRILKIIRAKSFHFNGNDISFTFSAGISICSELLKDQKIDSLIELADQRLYKAKNLGKDKVVLEV